MKRTKIAWVKNNDGSQGYTWNPVTGCRHGCGYCYARGIAKRFGRSPEEKAFKPMFWHDRISQPNSQQKPSTIFVCSMADLFGVWAPEWWISGVLKTVKETPWHTYIFLTKNGYRMADEGDVINTKNAWYGQTCTGISGRAVWDIPNGRSFLSLEPLLGDWLPDLQFLHIKWVIIGSLNKNGNPVPPEYGGTKKEWVVSILSAAEKYKIPVFVKPELYRLYPDLPPRQEVPYLQDWKGRQNA